MDLFISLLCALFLSIETALSFFDKSLCSTDACDIVGHSITIGEPLLIALGAAFFWILSGLFFFHKRYPRVLRYPIVITLFIAASFDASLIGFQYFGIGEKCILCIGVAVSILIISTIFFQYNFKNYILILPFIWLGVFFSHSIIEPVGQHSNETSIAFFKSQTKQTEPMVEKKAEATFIFSMNCPHCFEVVDHLASQDTSTISWRLALVDKDKNSRQKAQYFLNERPDIYNLFQKLLLAKQSDLSKQTKNELEPVSSRLSANTITFLRHLDLNTVPVLLFKQPGGQTTIYTDSKQIIKVVDNYLIEDK